MSDIGFQQNRFLTTATEAVDPMGGSVWAGLQPDGEDARSIRSAIGRVDDERIKGERRVEGIQEERQRALHKGTEHSLATIDARLTRATRWLERVCALAAALPAELDAAEAREAEAARKLAERQAAARVVIARFAKWVASDYEKHARAIAAGLALEQEAIAAARAAGLMGELPLAHTTAVEHPRGNPPTNFSRLVRLPNHVRGLPIAWPVESLERSSPYTSDR